MLLICRCVCVGLGLFCVYMLLIYRSIDISLFPFVSLIVYDILQYFQNLLNFPYNFVSSFFQSIIDVCMYDPMDLRQLCIVLEGLADNGRTNLEVRSY